MEVVQSNSPACALEKGPVGAFRSTSVPGVAPCLRLKNACLYCARFKITPLEVGYYGVASDFENSAAYFQKLVVNYSYCTPYYILVVAIVVVNRRCGNCRG